MIVMITWINKQYSAGSRASPASTVTAGARAPDRKRISRFSTALPWKIRCHGFSCRRPLQGRPGVRQYLRRSAARSAGHVHQLYRHGIYRIDTAFEKVPVEIFGRASAQQAMIVHMFNGNSARTSRPKRRMAGPTPVAADDLRGKPGPREARGNAGVPAGIRQAFSMAHRPHGDRQGKRSRCVQGLTGGAASANFYFDRVRQARADGALDPDRAAPCHTD